MKAVLQPTSSPVKTVSPGALRAGQTGSCVSALSGEQHASCVRSQHGIAHEAASLAVLQGLRAGHGLPARVPQAQRTQHGSLVQSSKATPGSASNRTGVSHAEDNAGAAIVTLQDLAASHPLWFQKLVGEHMTPACRRHLFKSTKTLAAGMIRHATRVNLKLRESRYGQPQSRTHALRMLLAAAQHSKLRVQLFDYVPDTLWSCVPKQQVSELVMHNMAFTADTFTDLQLQQCTSLRMLHLGGGCTAAASNISALAEERTAWLPSSLNSIEVPDLKVLDHVSPLVQLLAPQITHIICPSLTPTLASSFTILAHVECSSRLTDELLDVLASLPNLTHLTVPGAKLMGCYRNEPLKLQQLQFHGTAHLEWLLRLPLQNIQCLVLQGKLHCGDDNAMRECYAAHLASCPQLQCVPAVQLQGHGTLGRNQPRFVLSGCWAISIINMCGNSLTSNCILDLENLDLLYLAHNLNYLKLQSASKMTSLWLSAASLHTRPLTDNIRAYRRGVMWQNLAAGLPPSLRQIVLMVRDPHKDWWEHVAALANALVQPHRNGKPPTVYVPLRYARNPPPELQDVMETHKHVQVTDEEGYDLSWLKSEWFRVINR